MKSRSSKTSTGRSKPGKGLSRTVKVVGATTIGALAGGLVGAAITNRKRKGSPMGKTARKVKAWVKSAATNPTMKTMAKGVAQQMVEAQLSSRQSRKGQAESAGRATTKSTGKKKK